MKIGVMADTHNNREATRKALELFRSQGIVTILHAGDLEDPSMLEYFQDFNLYLARGNTDLLYQEINRKLTEMGKNPMQTFHELKLDGKNFLLIHGDDAIFFRQAVASGAYHYIIKGHTHFTEDYVRNNIRVLNPGALFRADEFTIGILDIPENSWRLFKIS